MNVSAIMSTIRKGVELIESLGPVTTMLGGSMVGSVVGIVKGVTDVIENIQARVDESSIVLNSNQAAEIKSLTARLAAVNDKLNERIRAS